MYIMRFPDALHVLILVKMWQASYSRSGLNLIHFLWLGVEIIQIENAAQSSQGKVHIKGGQSKQKSGKRHGYVYADTIFFHGE